MSGNLLSLLGLASPGPLSTATVSHVSQTGLIGSSQSTLSLISSPQSSTSVAATLSGLGLGAAGTFIAAGGIYGSVGSAGHTAFGGPPNFGSIGFPGLGPLQHAPAAPAATSVGLDQLLSLLTSTSNASSAPQMPLPGSLPLSTLSSLYKPAGGMAPAQTAQNAQNLLNNMGGLPSLNTLNPLNPFPLGLGGTGLTGLTGLGIGTLPGIGGLNCLGTMPGMGQLGQIGQPNSNLLNNPSLLAALANPNVLNSLTPVQLQSLINQFGLAGAGLGGVSGVSGLPGMGGSLSLGPLASGLGANLLSQSLQSGQSGAARLANQPIAAGAQPSAPALPAIPFPNRQGSAQPMHVKYAFLPFNSLQAHAITSFYQSLIQTSSVTIINHLRNTCRF